MPSFVNAPFHFGQKKLGVEHSGKAILSGIKDIIANSDCIIYCEPISHDLLNDENAGLIYKPDAVAEACKRVYDGCSKALKNCENSRPKRMITLGGDHSIAIGSIGAVFDHYALGPGIQDGMILNEPLVIWFDAHADINTLKTTQSGNIHGCPVAFLLDHPDTKGLSQFDWLYESNRNYKNRTGSSYIHPSRLAYIGLRDVEDGEKETMKEYGISNAWFMEDVKGACRDMDNIIRTILSNLDPEGKRPIHLSLDVDGVDPEFIPSTGTPVPDGITLEETLRMVQLLNETGRLMSVDIVEVNLFLGSKEDSEKTLLNTLRILKAIL